MIRFSRLCNFHPKQLEATRMAREYRFFLYGGSRGPGKSYWLRWFLLLRLLEFAARGLKNVNSLLACEDYPSLTDRQISKIETEFPSWLGWLGKRKGRGFGFHLKPDYGGGSILLRNLDNKSKIGAEYADIGVDELGLNSLETFNYLLGCHRWPGIDDPRFIGVTNPYGNWVRQFWIERRFPKHMERFRDDFAFLPALPQDNPSLSSSYWDMLEMLPDGLRQAWLHGDWYAAVEGLVYGSFSDDNLYEGEVIFDAPVEWTIDDGFSDPRAILFVQRVKDKLYVIDERYETEELEDFAIAEALEKMQMAEHFERWRQERAARGRKAMPDICVCSHEAVQLRTRLRRSQIPARSWFAKQHRSKKPRATAIQMTRGMICNGHGERSLLVHRRCRSLIDELSMNYRLEKRTDGSYSEHPEDGNDHAAQALEGYIFARCQDIARKYAA